MYFYVKFFKKQSLLKFQSPYLQLVMIKKAWPSKAPITGVNWGISSLMLSGSCDYCPRSCSVCKDRLNGVSTTCNEYRHPLYQSSARVEISPKRPSKTGCLQILSIWKLSRTLNLCQKQIMAGQSMEFKHIFHKRFIATVLAE
jgi:hypothetical protein